MEYIVLQRLSISTETDKQIIILLYATTLNNLKENTTDLLSKSLCYSIKSIHRYH